MVIKGKGGRELSGSYAWIVFGTALCFSIYQLYFLTVGIISPWIFRAGHLAFAMAIIFLLCPIGRRGKKDGFSVLDLLFAFLSIAIFVYIVVEQQDLVTRAGVNPNTLDVVFGSLTMILVVEGARRFFGPVLPIVAAVFLIYAYFGHWIPGIFGLPRYTLTRIISYEFSTTGIYGIAISTAATYVFLFVVFGAFLQHTGVGDVFMKLAMAFAGGVRGGPAKVSVISSALFGSISGSASSNVVTTGAFTIPLMKSVGYRGEFAAAVETAASIGGLFLPPIMGAGGFLIADILQIPYWEVVKAVTVPAILYYVVVFMLIDFEAVRLGLKGLARAELPKFWSVIKSSGHLLIPIVVLLYALLVIKISPVRAGLYSIVATVVISWVRVETRVGPKRLAEILSSGARQALNVSVATATAGIIVGIVQLTGLGLTFSSAMMSLSGTSVLLALILAMIVAVVMGMGLPITATYITAAAVLGPALIKIGIEPIAAHLFLYFFAAVSGMTPPVCVTAFAAAGVSGEDPMRVGWQSVKLGWAAYVLPYMFVFGPPLLLIGTWVETIVAICSALLGAFGIGTAVHGILGARLWWVTRTAFAVSGLLLIQVGTLTNVFGLGLMAAAYAWHRFVTQRAPESAPND